MNVIGTKSVVNKEDGLKYAYAFLKTELLNIKECGFINPNASQFDGKHIMPTDMYSATYTDKVPTWEEFKTNETNLSALGYSCVGCVDKEDKKRVNMSSIGEQLIFNCYGNYQSEAKRAYDDILAIHSTLK
jgi:hypothetical protein